MSLNPKIYEVREPELLRFGFLSSLPGRGTALLRQTLDCFCKGDVAVADRFYVIDTMTTEARRVYCVSRLGQIGKCLVGKRPGRFEPRVRKKRGSNAGTI